MTNDPLSTHRRRREGSTAGPKPPAWVRWLRNAAIWLILLFVGGALQGFFLEPPLQQRLCRWDPVQPACEALGMGDLPTEAMTRDLATAKATASREGWNAFRARYPDGPLDSEAERALAACRPSAEDRWRAEDMPPLPLRVPALAFVADEATSRQQVEAAAQAAGMRTCSAYDGGEYRLTGARLSGQGGPCETLNGRVACGWDGQVICQVQVREPVREVC